MPRVQSSELNKAKQFLIVTALALYEMYLLEDKSGLEVSLLAHLPGMCPTGVLALFKPKYLYTISVNVCGTRAQCAERLHSWPEIQMYL